ncbi:glycosyltransferase family 1 protein [Desulfonema ishimotonii]|uniref:Glycosyltransferase family 1 protein n=1 Tax=Desulfonema ishimotonii TaxID=45657 RepID=A0A401FZ05_9BACT|nr:glycosyltransferase [Desulfonema ishimotonii]GBC62211.1 glycosyltransferase family 1 protein [Desulfonema ishimotonii]
MSEKEHTSEKGEQYRPRVLICIPVLLTGGTEMQTLHLVRTLIAGNYRVTICCYHEYEENIAACFRESGAAVILLNLDRKQGIFRLFRSLRRVFMEFQDAVVHVQYISPGLLPIIAARLGGIRTVFATVHQPGRTYGLRAKCFLRVASLLATAFFCVSRSAEESWFGNSAVFAPDSGKRRRHYTIYNMVDVARIERIVKATDRLQLKKISGLEGNMVIGIVARLRAEKGHETLLRAMSEVVGTVPEACLLVIGDGPDRARLDELAGTLGSRQHIRWTGEKSPDSVFPYYAVMDAAVVPSRFEGFGLTAAEAMAAGVPVIGSDIDGLREVIENGVTGYLSRAGDSHELARKLILLLSDAERRKHMGKAGYDRVVRHFSPEHFSRAILAAYSRLSRIHPS